MVDASDASVSLHMEGRLTGRSVEELQHACDLRGSLESTRLALDLADASFADATGIELCKKLKGRNILLINPVTFLALHFQGPEDIKRSSQSGATEGKR